MKKTLFSAAALLLGAACVSAQGAAATDPGALAGRSRMNSPPATEGQTFAQFAAQHDANRDGVVTREEFRGQAELFDGLDTDRDGRITLADYNWAPPPLTETPRAPAATWSIENAALQAVLGSDGGLALRDKSTGLSWEPVRPAGAEVKAEGIVTGPDRRSLEASLRFAGETWTLRLGLVGEEPELKLTLEAPAHRPMPQDLFYPFPFRAPAGAYRAVVPHKTGLMFEVADATRPKVQGRYDIYADSGLSMPWFGVTDLERGLMARFDTPDDAGVEFRLTRTAQGEVFSPRPYWRPSMGRVNYARSLALRLFSGGGYVAMCKDYRRRLIESGNFVTLREKARTHPEVKKLIGAIDLYLWKTSDEDTRKIVGYFEQQGVQRMLINSEASPETNRWIRDRGHLLGVYTIFTGGPRTNSASIVPPTPEGHTTVPRQTGAGARGAARPPATGPAERARPAVPLGGLADATMNYVSADGVSQTRGGRCSLLHLSAMSSLLRPFVAENGYQALFFDVVTAAPLRECYSPVHWLDRTGDKRMKKALLEYASSLGVLVASEDGYDFACPVAHYFEGLVMPRRFGYLPGTTVNNWNRKFDLTQEYLAIDLGERVRAPLWDLVFHDSVVATWRWNFPPDRYSDRSFWDKHDLINVITGSMPIFLTDLELMKAHGDRVVQTYRTVCEWTEKIGWEEMVDHRALTPDRSVQESRFSSGWAVVVNFSADRPFTLPDGETIRPYSHLVRRWQPGS